MGVCASSSNTKAVTQKPLNTNTVATKKKATSLPKLKANKNKKKAKEGSFGGNRTPSSSNLSGDSRNGNVNITEILKAQLEEQKTQNKLMMEMVLELQKSQEKTQNLLREKKGYKSTPFPISNSQKNVKVHSSELSIESQVNALRMSKKRQKDRLDIQFQLVKPNPNATTSKSFQVLHSNYTPPLGQELNVHPQSNNKPNYLSLGKKGSNNTLSISRPASQISRSKDNKKTVKVKKKKLAEKPKSQRNGDQMSMMEDFGDSEILSESESSSEFEKPAFVKSERQVDRTSFQKQINRSTLKSQLLQEYVDTVMEENEETPKNALLSKSDALSDPGF